MMNRSTAQLLLYAGLVLAWILTVQHIRFQWGGESYYNYGWAVPLLAVYLLYKRLEDAPAEQPPPRRNQYMLMAVGLMIVVFIHPPLRVLSEVNPFWRVPLIGQSLALVILTMLIMTATMGWKRTLHLTFPVLFLLTMLPWPYRIEVQIIQALTEKVAQSTVILLGLLGNPAEVKGNLIVIGSQSVGVDEACSGIRSLQALTMMALFLGEYFRQSWPRRFALLAIGLLIVMGVNALRSLTLTLIVLRSGEAGYDYWHDTVGTVAFVGSAIFLYAASELLNLRAKPPRSEPNSSTKAEQPGSQPDMTWAVSFTAAIAVMAVGVEAWFRYHESRLPATPAWTIEWPPERKPFVQYTDISEAVHNVLKFDFGRKAAIYLPNYTYAEFFNYGYTGENRMNSVSSYGHSPTICMQSTGSRLLREFPILHFQKDNLRFPMRHYLFEIPTDTGPKSVHVFWTVAERRSMGIDAAELESLNWSSQFSQAIRGRRDYSRQVMLMAIYNAASPDIAEESMRWMLDDWVAVDSATATQ